MLETKIINYLSHLGDSDYMAEVATSPGAVETLIKMLQNDIENLFSKYMSTNNLATYTMQELETFIDHKIKQL